MIGKRLILAAGASVSALALGGASQGGAAPEQFPAANGRAEDRCAALKGREIGGAVIGTAAFVASGSVLPPFADKTATPFCRVEAVATPVAGSRIKLQMWLPAQWNGKFVGVGGGGFEGGYASAPIGLRAPVSAGYATLATDAGHPASVEPSWAIGNPEKVIDYGHRANHVGAAFGKAMVLDYYGTAARRAYFAGCSNGGRDALMLAQRYPNDYDAIVAGAPANAFTAVMASFFRAGQVSRAPGVELTAPKLELVHEAAVAKCDTADGLKDGLIAEPLSCRFDPAVLTCKPGKGGTCLSVGEVRAIKAIYRGVHTRSGREVLPGFPVGSEYNWAEWLTNSRALGVSMGQQFYRNFVHGDSKWNPATIDLDADHAAAMARVGPIIDARNPDLRPFLRRGGKLLMYHGWDDAAIPAGNSIEYYAAMKRASGPQAAAQTRLFMLSGVSHCTGGNGASAVDYLAEVDRWSEGSSAPERLVATKPESVYRAMAALPTKSLLTRPICAWPKVARYKGHGDTDDPASYVCR